MPLKFLQTSVISELFSATVRIACSKQADVPMNLAVHKHSITDQVGKHTEMIARIYFVEEDL